MCERQQNVFVITKNAMKREEKLMKIAYVVLHFMAVKETIECAESLLSLNDVNSESIIIIVDNCSPDNSFSVLKGKYANNNRVIIIHNDENLGYAKGNNVGYKYAKYECKADVIVQINNDTLITQKDFNDILLKKIGLYKYYVIGPDIITKDGYHQNPVNKKHFKINETKKYRVKKRIKMFFIMIGVDGWFSKNKDLVYRKDTLVGDYENMFLHGACYIFTPKFIECYDGLDPRTFLFWEEDILMLKLKRENKPVLYTSDLMICHKEDASTDSYMKKAKSKKLWIEEQLIKSSKIYEEVYREGE